MDQREQQLQSVDRSLLAISDSSLRGRNFALEDLKWKTHVELSSAALPILSQLTAREMRLNELAAAIHVTGPAISRQVQALVDKGLVARRPDEADARATVVRLSTRGVEVVTESLEARIAMLRQVFAEWSDGDLEQLAPGLHRLADELARWDHR